MPQDEGVGTWSSTWTSPISEIWTAFWHLLPQFTPGTHWCYCWVGGFLSWHQATRSPFNSWVDWSNESKVPCSKKQQQHQSGQTGNRTHDLLIIKVMPWPLGYAASHTHTPWLRISFENWVSGELSDINIWWPSLSGEFGWNLNEVMMGWRAWNYGQTSVIFQASVLTHLKFFCPDSISNYIIEYIRSFQNIIPGPELAFPRYLL